MFGIVLFVKAVYCEAPGNEYCFKIDPVTWDRSYLHSSKDADRDVEADSFFLSGL